MNTDDSVPLSQLNRSLRSLKDDEQTASWLETFGLDRISMSNN